MMAERLNLPTESSDQFSLIHFECEQAAIATFLRSAIFDTELIYQKHVKVHLIGLSIEIPYLMIKLKSWFQWNACISIGKPLV